jgi:hypothetical protein
LYHQLIWTMNRLSIGYYSWREGRLVELRFKDGVTARLAPDLNAGSAALQYYFSQIYTGEEWVQALDMQQGLPALYERMFGSPWLRAQAVEPLYPPGLAQPPLILPFEVERVWSFTGGPHGAWEHDGSYAALDFAPASSASGCLKSNAWVTAASAGLVVRSGNGVVVLDLDGDGYEQTGWVVLYLHVSIEGAPGGHLGRRRRPVGAPPLARRPVHRHASPLPANTTASGSRLRSMPFVLSGWMAQAGEQAYKGNLTREDRIIPACTCASLSTNIIRSVDDPYEAGS